MSNKLLATLLLVLTFVGIAYSGIIARPTKTTGGTSYTDGTVPHASDFNGDMDTIYSDYNGNITNANISPTAAIAASKISPNFGTNIQVTTAAVPCFVNIDSSLGADLKQWRICQAAGVLSIATYTDAGALIITPLSIARATGQVTLTSDLILTAGAIQVNALTAKSFLYTGASGLLSTPTAPTNGQLLIGNTGNAPSVNALTGTATHVCVTNGAGTITLDFCANPTITAPVFAGTATGTYTLGGTPTIAGSTLTGTTAVQGLVDLTNASAGQLKFPSTQNPSANANTLDDYSEGTWTPSIGGTATYFDQTGVYVKIGRMVTATFRININAIGTGSLNTISGLPYTSTTQANIRFTGSVWFSGLSQTVSYVVASVGSNTTSIILDSMLVEATATNSNNIITASTIVQGTISYLAAN